MLPGIAAAQAPAQPTFAKDVAPIFQEKCEACHRPDSIAPMSLKTYAETRPWARAIKARVADHTMPPWDIDRTVGVQKFKNDRSLTDAETETIVRWVDAGAPPGDPKDMPAARTWPEDQGWNFAALLRPEGARPDRQLAQLHDAGAVAGRVGQARHALRASPSPAGCARSRSGRRP